MSYIVLPPAYAVEVMFCSVCLSVQAVTLEVSNIETSFLVWWYIMTISGSSLSGSKFSPSYRVSKYWPMKICTGPVLRHFLKILLNVFIPK